MARANQTHNLEMKTGTEWFILGTTALTFPSILSLYYMKFNLRGPLLSSHFINENGYLKYVSSPFQLLSNPSTLITHTFHHENIG